jgi:hypothetical protein
MPCRITTNLYNWPTWTVGARLPEGLSQLATETQFSITPSLHCDGELSKLYSYVIKFCLGSVKSSVLINFVISIVEKSGRGDLLYSIVSTWLSDISGRENLASILYTWSVDSANVYIDDMLSLRKNVFTSPGGNKATNDPAWDSEPMLWSFALFTVSLLFTQSSFFWSSNGSDVS